MFVATVQAAANDRRIAEPATSRQPAGDTAGRITAFKRGLAGGMGERLGVDEEIQLVAERAAMFARELQAVGGTGQILAHRAAVLSVRIERLAVADMAAVAAAECRAVADFDADRRDAIAELMAEAEDPAGDPAPALEALADCPDGLARLIAAWRDLAGRLDGDEAEAVAGQVARWLGVAADVPAADLARRVAAERDRLAQLATKQGADLRLLDQARREAKADARANPAPALVAARRYEAAAERGLFRAIGTIADINRRAGRIAGTEGGVGMSGLGAIIAATSDQRGPMPPPSRRPADPLASFRPAGPDPLASFRPPVAEPLASFRIGVAPTKPGPLGPEPVAPAAVGRPDQRPEGRPAARDRR